MPEFNLRLIGEQGETLAGALLKEKGYKILGKNWRNRFGEIDIVASRKDVVIFVEVKARTSSKFGEAAEAITNYKKRRLRLLAEAYVQEEKLEDKFIRFDVVTVEWETNNAVPKIEHLENVLFFDN